MSFTCLNPQPWQKVYWSDLLKQTTSLYAGTVRIMVTEHIDVKNELKNIIHRARYLPFSFLKFCFDDKSVFTFENLQKNTSPQLNLCLINLKKYHSSLFFFFKLTLALTAAMATTWLLKCFFFFWTYANTSANTQRTIIKRASLFSQAFIQYKEIKITVMLNKNCIYSKTNHQCRGF